MEKVVGRLRVWARAGSWLGPDATHRGRQAASVVGTGTGQTPRVVAVVGGGAKSRQRRHRVGVGRRGAGQSRWLIGAGWSTVSGEWRRCAGRSQQRCRKNFKSC
jgi:hypothetical protein